MKSAEVNRLPSIGSPASDRRDAQAATASNRIAFPTEMWYLCSSGLLVRASSIMWPLPQGIDVNISIEVNSVWDRAVASCSSNPATISAALAPGGPSIDVSVEVEN